MGSSSGRKVEDVDASSSTRHRLPTARLVVGVGVGALAVWFVVSTAGGLADAGDSMRQMRPGWLAAVALAAFVRIGLYGLQIRWLARRSGPISVGAALGLSFVVFGFGAVTPAAPAEGLALAARDLRSRGRSKQQARLTLGLSEWFAQRTFYAVTAINLVVVVSVGHLAWAESWPFALAGVLVIVLLAVTAGLARRPASAERAAVILGALRFGRPGPAPADRRQAATAWHGAAMNIVGRPTNRLRLVAVSAAAVLVDAAALWAACTASGIHLSFEVVVLAATVGTMASWIPLLPGGLGLVEGVIPVVLHRFGVPLAGGLAATVAYRALGTLVPALAGAGVAAAVRSRSTRHRHERLGARGSRNEEPDLPISDR